MDFSRAPCLQPGSVSCMTGSQLCKDTQTFRGALTQTPLCQTMQNSPMAALFLQSADISAVPALPRGWCLLPRALLSPLAPLEQEGADSRTRQLCRAVLLLSSTHTLGTSPSLEILWPAVEWALCSRTRVLALALNPLQFLAQLSLSPRGFTLGWREGQPDP